MNNTTEFTIKTLKADNVTEYTNENFNKYLSENGIKLIHSTPGYPQQNGRSERINQTLNNCATTLLNSAKLLLNFLDSAILCAYRLYNLNPHQGNNSKIPDEVFFNKPIDISHLRVFGCRVYFYNNHKKNKFENNSKPGIFHGYASDSTVLYQLETFFISWKIFLELLILPFYQKNILILFFLRIIQLRGKKAIMIN